MPPQQIRKIYTRSALKRRSTYIEPIAKEQPKMNSYDYLDLADEIGFTPLHKAVVTKQYSTCQQLLSKGVNVNKPALNGMNALLFATRHGDFMSVQILLSSDSCDVNSKDKGGWTALHHCAVNNHLMIAEMLLVVGADPYIRGKKGELAVDVAPAPDMQILLQSFMNNQHKFPKEEHKKCLLISRKGEIIRSNHLGVELEVPKVALRGSLFVVCRRIPAACNTVELGQSEIMISDVYEFWPPKVLFASAILLQIECVPTNEGEEIVLKMDGDVEIALFREKQPSIYVNKKSQSPHQSSIELAAETTRKFSVNQLCRMYVVSRLPKETYKVPLVGSSVQHSTASDLSITVPKNGLNSEATISLQLYPVASDLVKQIQKQYHQIVSMGAICELTHTDTETITRRLVTMTIPLPEDYDARKFDGRLVIVSGTEDESQLPEVIEKNHAQGSSVEFLTRHLTWKVAVLVKQVNVNTLSEVCQSVRKYTRKRMHFVSYAPMYKIDTISNTLTLTLVIVDSNNETQTIIDSTKQGHTIAKLTKKPASHMLCEGEVSHLQVDDDKQTSVSVAYFNKQTSRRSLSISHSRNKTIKFTIMSASKNNVLCEGEI